MSEVIEGTFAFHLRYLRCMHNNPEKKQNKPACFHDVNYWLKETLKHAGQL